MLYPLTFHPVFKERVWGGRNLERLYQKPLPPRMPIGESWEISDRPGDVSVLANGPFAGKDLHWLMQNHAAELLGSVAPHPPRFPLLVKILDAREKLSLQVHPPAAQAAKLGGEPKTEMWYIVDAAPRAELYAGLAQGVTRATFEQNLRAGTVAGCFHCLSVQPGDALFLPSGRVHAIGAGLVIFEIQQNSDTTYRVFDWNRAGLDGKPRELHVAQSLACIDFSDFEPQLASRGGATSGPLKTRRLVADPLFTVDVLSAETRESMAFSPGKLKILAVVNGRLAITDGRNPVERRSGQFCLIPAGIEAEIWAEPGSTFLLVQTGE